MQVQVIRQDKCGRGTDNNHTNAATVPARQS